MRMPQRSRERHAQFLHGITASEVDATTLTITVSVVSRAEPGHLRDEGLPARFVDGNQRSPSKRRGSITDVAAHVRGMPAGTEFTTSDIVDAVGGFSNTITNGIKRAQEQGTKIERLNQTTYKVA